MDINQEIKNSLVGKPCKANIHNKIIDGTILGRLCDFAYFVSNDGVSSFMISWILAEKAVNKNVIIQF
jgi:hypothetical protein